MIAACGDFLGRDTDSPSGDPNDPRTTTFIDAPLTGDRLLRALRGCLHMQCTIPIRCCGAFTVSSARSFLSEIASCFAQMSVEELNEIGRWSECAIKAKGVLAPPARHHADYLARITILPERYASCGTILNAARVVRETLDQLRAVVAALPDPLDMAALGQWHQINPRLRAISPEHLLASLPSSANEPPLLEGAPADAGHAARSAVPHAASSAVPHAASFAVPHAASSAVPQQPRRSLLEVLELELENFDD